MQSQPSERVAIVGAISPVNGNNTTTLTDAVDMSKWQEAMFILQSGVIDQVVDFKLTSSTASGGTYQDIPSKSITQWAATKDNKQAIINLKSEEMIAGDRYVKGSVTVGNGTSSLISAVCLGMKPRFAPANDDDLAGVDQIIT